MSRYVNRLSSYVFFSIVFSLSFVNQTLAASSCDTWVATIVSAQGSVEIRNAKDWKAVQVNQGFCPGDSIRVRSNSRATVRMQKDQTNLSLGQGSTITFTKPSDMSASIIEFFKGVVHFMSREPNALTIKTPYVNASIEGTEFVISVDDTQTGLSVLEGKVAFENTQGKLHVTSGQSAIAKANQAPELNLTINPLNAVQWVLYYPPIIRYTMEDFKSSLNDIVLSGVKDALDKHNAGNSSAALQVLQSIKTDVKDARFYNLRASFAIALGNIKTAEADLSKSLSIQSDNSDALALASIIAVTQNKVKQALQLAQQALKSMQPSTAQLATAQLAMSYAQQADFNLDAALQSALKASQQDAGNAYVWTRLSELWLMHGDVNQSLQTANKAIQVAGNSARNYSVLGFAHLSRLNIKLAQQTFEKAIKLDQAAPLPRLGLGLILIRQGQLEKGREQLEIATSLDPLNSLLRSYVGKAYFAEGRNEKAAEQFAMAKQLDPKDPTPYLYDAIRKQAESQPVEALHDLQKSVVLNDNRGVYRSRLQLATDNVEKSLNTASVYKELGFDHLAYLQGIRSAFIDPLQATTHKLLADSYKKSSGNRIARASELFQYQLLSSVNEDALPPQANEQRFLFRGNISTAPSLNQYGSMFLSDRDSMEFGFLSGTNNTFSNNWLLSTQSDRTSLAFGRYDYSTDGYRENNHLIHDVTNMVFRLDAGYSTSIQLELNSRITAYGDLNQTYNNSFTTVDNSKIATDTVRVSAHKKLTANSSFLISANQYKETTTLDKGTFETFVPPMFTSPIFPIAGLYSITLEDSSSRKGSGLEFAVIQREKQYSVQSGFIYFAEEKNKSIIFARSKLDLPTLPPLVTVTPFQDEQNQGSVYFYMNSLSSSAFRSTLGLSFDKYNSHSQVSSSIDQNRVNPKLGFAYDINRNFTARAARFKSIRRDSYLNTTLEPTNIVGFTQFYDEAASSISDRAALAFDYDNHRNLFWGLEISKRKIREPVVNGTVNKEEYLHKIHFGRILAFGITLNAEFVYDKYDSEQIAFFPGPFYMVTRSMPLSIHFSKAGLSVEFKTTYVDQEVLALAQTQPGVFQVTSGTESFAVSDLLLQYNLRDNSSYIGLSLHNIFNDGFVFQDRNFQHIEPALPQYVPERTAYIYFSGRF